jgi:hypothetical protein
MPGAPHPLDEPGDLGVLGRAKGLGGVPALDPGGGEAQHPLGGAVDRRDVPGRVEGDHAGGHRLQHRLGVVAALLHLIVLRLEVAVGLFELGLGRCEVAGHPVERVHEDADFVVGAYLDLVLQVS